MCSRRKALRCMASAGAGALFVLAGGVLTPVDLASAASKTDRSLRSGKTMFVQVSDTHIGFDMDPNHDVDSTLLQTIQHVNALPEQPALVIHTGDITNYAKPAEFETAQHLLSRLRVAEVHTVPGEHDIADPGATDYFRSFGKPSRNKGYYSFDHSGVHFVALVNVLELQPSGLGMLGDEQLAWVESDLRGQSDSTPIVVFAHIPLWTVYERWGWGTGDAAVLMGYLRRFGSVVVLNGHIHQIMQKVEGNVIFHTARSTAFPLPLAGATPTLAPLQVGADDLPRMLGITSVSLRQYPRALELADSTLA